MIIDYNTKHDCKIPLRHFGNVHTFNQVKRCPKLKKVCETFLRIVVNALTLRKIVRCS